MGGTPVAWRDLERILEEHPAEWMLWEGEPIAETSEKLKEMDLEKLRENVYLINTEAEYLHHLKILGRSAARLSSMKGEDSETFLKIRVGLQKLLHGLLVGEYLRPAVFILLNRQIIGSEDFRHHGINLFLHFTHLLHGRLVCL